MVVALPDKPWQVALIDLGRRITPRINPDLFAQNIILKMFDRTYYKCSKKKKLEIVNGCGVVTPIAGQGKRDGRQEQEVRALDPTVGREDFERWKVGKISESD